MNITNYLLNWTCMYCKVERYPSKSLNEYETRVPFLLKCLTPKYVMYVARIQINECSPLIDNN